MAENEKEKIIEGPGFIIRDRRHVTQEGEKREQPPDAKEQQAEPDKSESARPSADQRPGKREKASRGEEKEVPLPEVNFINFIFSLVHSAMLAMGNLPDPATGKTEQHLPTAKHIIDTIGMLQQKTQGNLTEDEQRLMEDSLFNLRLRYVEEKDKLSKQ